MFAPNRTAEASADGSVLITDEPVHAAVEDLLTPAEVARIFRVDPKTIGRWADDGKLSVIRTAGRQRRYLAAEVDTLYRAGFQANPGGGEAA